MLARVARERLGAISESTLTPAGVKRAYGARLKVATATVAVAGLVGRLQTPHIA
jgi:hypothetical protein